MYELSEIYDEGKITSSDPVQSFEWCKKAAEASPNEYWADIASKYFYGTGTEVNLEKAWEWAKGRKVETTLSWPGNLWNEIRKAYEKEEKKQLTEQANTGDAAVQLELGKKLLGKDWLEAEKWLEKAAEQGNGEAMMQLGNYINQNWNDSAAMKEEAMKWYQKAKDQGVSGAEEKFAAVTAEIRQMRAADAAELERFCDCLKRGQEGDPEALADLVKCCEEGIGTDKSEKMRIILPCAWQRSISRRICRGFRKSRRPPYPLLLRGGRRNGEAETLTERRSIMWKRPLTETRRRCAGLQICIVR